MDKLVSRLLEENFVRTVEPISPEKPLVIHGVAGCGKTRLLEQLAETVPDLHVFTTQTSQGQTLSGRRITSLPPDFVPVPGNLYFLDEYIGTAGLERFNALFADPLQYNSEPCLAHFVKPVSHRFGKLTAELISTRLKIPVSSDRSDVLITEDIWRHVNVGQAITLEDDVHQLLSSQGLSHIRAADARGLTFDQVSLYTKSPYFEEVEQHLAYIGLTRHRYKLYIVCPDHSDYPHATSSNSS
uniref:TGB1 n=1 Tax=Phyllanthus potexvirus 1 TaxID=2794412 RepID=A0A7T5QZ88_9VIRU|nr:TGB1 [Phyllanthus potexvirus 1]